MRVHHFKLEFPPGARANPHTMQHCVVTMDGEPLKGVRGATITTHVEDANRVTIEFIATAEVVYADEEG